MSNARTWLGRRKFLLSAAAAVASPVIARADSWPSRPVHIICPLAAGGGIDATARIVGARLGDIWGQRVVVENKPGASGNIAAEYAAHAEPDGYTIYIPSFFHTTNAFLVPSHTYDAVADFAPVTLIATYPLVMVVPTSSPARTVQEFIAYARTKKVSFASSGYGSSLHLAAELFTRSAGIEMTHVPYRGAGPAFTDLIAGRVDAMINFTSSSLPLVRQGQLRALAVTTAKRLSVAPDLPTMAEGGVAGVEVASWSAFLVPAKTSREIVGKIHDDTIKALDEPTVRDKLESTGAVVIGSTPAELTSFLEAERSKWGRVIKAANIQPLKGP
jgi:tripartite-type tricarboxylate transporter receptor subunit TctC